MPAIKEFSQRVFLVFVLAVLGACSGGDGTLFSGTDGDAGSSTKVGDVQVSFSAIDGSDTAVLLQVQVVDEDSVFLSGATVRFIRDGLPSSIKIATDSNVTDTGGLVSAILSFPAGYTEEILLGLEVQGTGDKTPFTTTVAIRPGVLDEAPDVDNLVVEVESITGSSNELQLTITALGRLNQPLSDATIFVRLGLGAPGGVSVIVADPVTNDSGIVTARVVVPEGLTQAIPLLVSVDGQEDASASVSLTVLPPGVEGVVGGLQVLTSTDNVTDDNEVELIARVVGQQNQLLSGVSVFFDLLDGAPSGAFIRVTDDTADGDEGARAILTFPAGATDAIDVLVSVQTGNPATPVISRTVSVALTSEEAPFVSQIQLTAEYDASGLADNEVLVRALALGRYNELVDGATIFFQLGAGAAPGSLLRVPLQDPVTSGTGGITAIVTFPEGFSGAIPVIASVVGGGDQVPVPQSINVLSPFARSPVGGLQLVSSRIGTSAEVLVTARVVDTSSSLLSGVPVRFRLSGAPAQSFVRVTQAESDANGEATAIVTFPSNDFTGTISVIAEIDTGNAVTPVISRALDVSLGIEDDTPFVSDIELQFVKNSSNDQAVDIYARVVDAGRGLVDGVIVSFSFGAVIPAGAQLYATQPVTSGDEGAIATLVFPDGYASSILVVASASGRNNSSATDSISVPSPIVVSEPEPDVATLRLVATSNTLDSDADLVSEGITLTAIATDASNNLLEGATVLFTTCELSGTACTASPDKGGAGALLVNRAKTDAQGTAEATLTTSGNVRNRRIRVTASSRKDPTKTATFDVTVTGTSLTLIGPGQLASNSSATYTATLRNSGSFAVSGESVSFVQGAAGISSSDQAALTAACATGTILATVETGANGGAQYTVVSPTSDFTLVACALQNSIASGVNVTVAATGLTVNFATALATDPDVNFGVCRELTLAFTAAAPAQVAAQTLSVGITRGRTYINIDEDANGNGVLDTEEDANGNGVLDPGEDINGNGVLDTEEDANGNGVLDPGEDINGNGVLDTEEDANGNGVLDPGEDINGNGVLDTDEDTDGNGFLRVGEDINGNGVLDLGEDANGNGVLDPFACITQTDVDNVITNRNGEVSVLIQSSGPDGAGLATVSATHSSGATDDLTVEFVAISPTRLDLSAEPSTVPTNGTATIRAVVRDANNNLVKNQTVSFNLQDPSGGTLSAASQITDSQGRAEVTYTASGATSARDAVSITAGIAGTNISNSVNLTVGGDALRISLGTGNSVIEPNETTYQLPYAVIVTDALGNPAPPETQFRLSVRALTYDKGIYVYVDPSWVKVTGTRITDDPNIATNPPDDPNVFEPGNSGELRYAQGCVNEDFDLDGVLDPNFTEDLNGNTVLDPGEDYFVDQFVPAPARGQGVIDVGEDFNGDGILTPGNVVSVPTTVALQTDGTAQFNLTYAQQYANWVQIELRAIASVSGTEVTETQTFFLPGAASDFSDENVNPPGNPSPFGTSYTCANAF